MAEPEPVPGPGYAAPESAVLVPVPEAEAAIGDLRRRIDRVGGQRVPAHVTVVYPFVPPDRLDAGAEARLAAAVASVPAFEAWFDRVAWFGDGVLYLPAEPAAHFRRLTEAVVGAFPDHPPYQGAYSDPIPHLTVGAESPAADLRAAVPAAEAALPLRTDVTHAVLVQGTGDRPWQVRARLPLSPRPS